MRRLLNLLSPIPFPAWFMRFGGRLNAAWLRIARGRGPLSSNVLILTTRGRRSGQERSTVVLYFDRGAARYVVASFAGLDRMPAWYLNAVADPHVTADVRGEVTRCRARVLDAGEATELWPFLDQAYPGFRRYRSRTSRPIPIVELMADIELREITEANRDAVVAISGGPAEGRFVSSVADSLEEAAETPEGSPWYRAVYLGGEPVGFVMLSWDVTPQPPDIIGPWFLWKLIVDEPYQRRGIGRSIVEEAVRLISAEGATELFTSHVIGEGGPDGFYERLGFVPTGEFDPQGERILRLELPPQT